MMRRGACAAEESHSACSGDRSAAGRCRRDPVRRGASVQTKQPPRILIVDDEEALADSLLKAAAAQGYEAEAARDGVEALELLRGRPFDVIVTDLRMPRMDGPTLLGRLEQEGIATRAVVITGYATMDAAVDCLRKGAVDFLVKPFEVEHFLQSVRRAAAQSPRRGRTTPDWHALRQRFKLTPRETEVLQGVYATGKTNRELAEELCVAPETVKSHLKAAFQKLAVSNRTQMLRVIHEAA